MFPRTPASALSLLSFFALAACSSSSSSGTALTDAGSSADSAAADTGTSPDGASATDAGADAGPLTGSGTVTGSVGGVSFGPVLRAYLIGAPDLATTTAIYLVGTPGVACADMNRSGWSHLVAPGIPIYEMILATQTPAAGAYTVSTATTLPAGSAEVNYLTSSPSRTEVRAATGTITLSALTPGVSATGTFSVKFPVTVDGGTADGLDGTFDAVYCAVGHEP